MNYEAGILAQRWREEMVGNSPDMEPAMEICYPSFEDIWGSELLGNETYSWFVGVIGTSKPTYLFTHVVEWFDESVIVYTIASEDQIYAILCFQ